MRPTILAYATPDRGRRTRRWAQVADCVGCVLVLVFVTLLALGPVWLFALFFRIEVAG